jgi:hypothetical protein
MLQAWPRLMSLMVLSYSYMSVKAIAANIRGSADVSLFPWLPRSYFTAKIDPSSGDIWSSRTAARQTSRAQ